ncbi:MAG: hypothetical protein JXB38_08600 [Anaerolineales bacterium]|nr:hypothetical protein [Anaerolineales bacterium]
MKRNQTILLMLIPLLLLALLPTAAQAQEGPEPDVNDGEVSVNWNEECQCYTTGDGGDSDDYPGENNPGTEGSDDWEVTWEEGGHNADGGVDAGDDFSIGGQAWCYPTGDGPSEEDLNSQGGWEVGEDGTVSCNWACEDDSVSFTASGDGAWSISANAGTDQNWDFLDFEPSNATGAQAMENGTTDMLGYVDDQGIATGMGIPACGGWDTTGSQLSGYHRVLQICWRELSIFGSSGSDSGIGTEENPGDSSPGGADSSPGGYNFTCGGSYDATASTTIPCPAVIREPYPRALVNAPIRFVLGANGSSSGADTTEVCEEDIRNYTIKVGWNQMPIVPTWNFDERPWSDQPSSGLGWTVYHTYDTASYGLEENGPDLHGHMTYPAYQISVSTWWLPWVSESWEQWHEFEWDCKEEVTPTGDLIWEGSECEERWACDGAAIGDEGCGEWKKHGSGQIPIDLRWFGYSFPYARRWSAEDATQPPPESGIPAVPPEERRCEIPVPVIESQGLLTIP